MAQWLALQNRPHGGKAVLVTFDERPIREHAARLVLGSLREIPPEIQDAPLSVLIDWVNSTAAASAAPVTEAVDVPSASRLPLGLGVPAGERRRFALDLSDQEACIFIALFGSGCLVYRGGNWSETHLSLVANWKGYLDSLPAETIQAFSNRIERELAGAGSG